MMTKCTQGINSLLLNGSKQFESVQCVVKWGRSEQDLLQGGTLSICQNHGTPKTPGDQSKTQTEYILNTSHMH